MDIYGERERGEGGGEGLQGQINGKESACDDEERT